jgi:hypothetical protein
MFTAIMGSAVSSHTVKRKKTGNEGALSSLRRVEEVCQRIRSRLAAAGVTRADLLASLPEARERLYARVYGKRSSGKSHRTK